MFNTAPVLSQSSPNIDDSWHNSLNYTWVSLRLDKLWCYSNRMIVSWILMMHSWELRFWCLGCTTTYYFQSFPLIGLYNPITTSSSLLLLMHRNRLQPSRRMDNPGCCCSFCQTKIETGIRAKNNLVFVFDNWPFQRRSVLASSPPDSPVSTKIECACVLLFTSLSNHQVMGILLTARGPLCFVSR